MGFWRLLATCGIEMRTVSGSSMCIFEFSSLHSISFGFAICRAEIFHADTQRSVFWDSFGFAFAQNLIDCVESGTSSTGFLNPLAFHPYQLTISPSFIISFFEENEKVVKRKSWVVKREHCDECTKEGGRTQ